MGLFGGGNGKRRKERHEQEQEGIRGNVEVKVDEAVDQDAKAAREPREVKNTRKRAGRFLNSPHGGDEQYRQEPCAAKTSKQPGLRKNLQIIVVCVVDNFSVVLRFVRRIGRLKRAKSDARDRMIQKHAPGALAH